jgi:PAS domain S-box-containing protein
VPAAHRIGVPAFARQSATWVLLAAAYALAGRLGLALAFVNPSATAVWPPAGIALAAVLMLGPRVWPGIFLGAFIVNELTAGSLATSLLIASGNTLEALAAGYLVNRFAGGRRVFDRVHNIIRFVLAATAGAAISASIGVATICFFGLGRWQDFGSIWTTWWLGDLAGAMVVTPVILLWAAQPRLDWPAAERVELMLLAVTAAVVGWVVFVAVSHPLSYLTIPVCVWAAFRFGQREAATVTCALSFLAVWSSARGLGTFAQASPNDSLLLVESFMAVASGVGLTVATAASERRRAEEGLRRSHGELTTRMDQRSRDLEVSERRLQTIIDTEPACVKLVSADGVLLDMNPAGLAMIGAQDVSQVRGRRVIDLVHPDDRARFLEMHQQAAGGPAGRLEFRIVGFNGLERWVDSHCVRFDVPNDTGGKDTAVLSVTSDITGRKRLEDELRHSQKMEAIGLLAGGIAHDFNNLLTSIAGNTDVVLNSFGQDDKRRIDLEEVAKAADRAAALTRQLLAVSRRQMLQPTVIDLNAMVADVQTLLRRTIPESIDLQLDLRPVESIRADRGQIEQVLLNLAINAGHAMPNGGTLRVSTAIVDLDDASTERRAPMPTGRYVRLTMSDTGVGIPREAQARIFEPFFTTKDRDRGTGLGLAIVYGIVKQSGGYIWVDSDVGRGTTFAIFLPSVDEPAAVYAPAPPRIPVGRGSQTILLAEDDAAVRRFARNVLKDHGYKVLDAGDGDEALEIARQYPEPIHALVTDVVMPGLSGRDLAERLTADRPNVRVIYTSGYTENVMLRAGFERGLTLLPKPFLPGDLLRIVNDTLTT